MALLIGLGTALYHLGIRLAAPFVPKARLWVDGRKDGWTRLETKTKELQGCLWMHCASVGEFEQGRPVLEALLAEHPGHPVLLTFFSPSGYEARKNYPLATHVEYLPTDSAVNAARLLELVRPKAAVFIKYEFWYQHLMALKRAGIPTFLVSAIFRPSQPFFRWYGGAHRSMLDCFSLLFVQDEASRELLKSIGVEHVAVSGDTRFDRVAAIVAKNDDLLVADRFRRGSESRLLVAGSTWPSDEKILRDAIALRGEPLRSMIVPHELHAAHLDDISNTFPAPVVRWTVAEVASTRSLGEAAPTLETAPTLLVDRMGLLSGLYKYADITYVGGGFGSGIHNLLEAAAWGKPVIFGPNHERFAEAQGLIDAGAGFVVKSAPELRMVLDRLLSDPAALERARANAGNYVRARTGATAHVVQEVTRSLR